LCENCTPLERLGDSGKTGKPGNHPNCEKIAQCKITIFWGGDYVIITIIITAILLYNYKIK